MSSEYLDRNQLSGLRKAGDVLVPGDGDLPAFSEADVATNVDRMVAVMRPDDREAFELLLTALGYLPRPAVAAVIRLSSYGDRLPDPVGRGLRMVHLAVSGTVSTLYYSEAAADGRVHEVVGWDASVETDPDALDQDQRRSVEARRQADGPGPDADPASQFRVADTASEDVATTPVEERCRLLRSLQSVILEERERIVDEIQAATGKTRTDALVSEVFGVLDHLDYLADEAPAVLADESVGTPLALQGKTSAVYYEPLGTVLVIAPWNYPFYEAIAPVTSALVAGNAVVFKPSEHTPMEGLLEDLFELAGIPPEWVQVVYGGPEVGRELVDQEPDKVFFTGSQEAGREVMRQAADALTPVTLELGGKDPMIVFDDATVERAAAGATWGAFTNAGQSCTSIERLYVHDDIYDRFVADLDARVSALTQGVDDVPSCDVGAMTTEFQVETVREHLDDAEERGATVLTGGWEEDSELLPPTVLLDVAEDSLVATEETFGPLLPVFRFADESAVVDRANDTGYGLAASVWSADLDRARRVARALEVGNVSINNVMITEANPALPFGGTKRSGFGRYKGEAGLRSFCNLKSVVHEPDSGDVDPNWYPYDRRKYELFSKMMSGLFSDSRLSLPRFAINGLRLERYANKTAERESVPEDAADDGRPRG